MQPQPLQYWLMKSEPNVFGIEHLQNMPEQRDRWDGIRNYQARNFMRDQMSMGDLIFFYHSNCPQPGVTGIMEVVRTAYPDFTAWDPACHYFDPKSSPKNPRWVMVDVQLVKTFSHPLSLDILRGLKGLEKMELLRKGSRLSVQPVRESEWKIILSFTQK